MADKTFIDSKIQELLTSNPGVNEIYYGKKTISGNITEEDSFVFGVTKKKPIEELTENEILPPSIVSGSVEIKTDVVEIEPIYTLDSLDFITSARTASNRNVTVAISVQEISGSSFIKLIGPEDEEFTQEEIDYLIMQAVNGGKKIGIREGEEATISVDIPSYCPDCYQTPFNQQTTVRPLLGGVQIGASEISGVGTLGFLAIDNDTQALVGVTNLHVTSYDGFKVTDVGTGQSGLAAYYVTANGPNNRLGQPVSSNTLGPFLRFVPLNISSTNTTDGAIFAIPESAIDLNQSFKQYGLSWSSPMEFATTAEIDSITSSTELYSSGRTTGPKEGVCGLRAVNTNVAVNVSGYRDNSKSLVRTVAFSNVLSFRRIDSTCPYPINAGDSGSALIANFGGTWKIIGLCFAGSPYRGYACRIDNVASALGISAWNGTAPKYIDPNSLKTFTVVGRQSSNTATYNDQTYYAVGTSITDGTVN